MALMTVYVDGERHRALPGQTVAALLLATGHRSWRTTRLGGRPRGVFCGIGVCYDCLLVVNGLPDVRACLRELRDGDRVETLRGARLPARTEAPETVRPVRDAEEPVRDAEEPARNAEEPARNAEEPARNAEEPTRRDAEEKDGLDEADEVA